MVTTAKISSLDAEHVRRFPGGRANPDVARDALEHLWWRCHRRLIADVAVMAHGVAVRHVMPDGGFTEHTPAAGARLGEDGLVRWPG